MLPEGRRSGPSVGRMNQKLAPVPYTDSHADAAAMHLDEAVR